MIEANLLCVAAENFCGRPQPDTVPEIDVNWKAVKVTVPKVFLAKE